MTHRVFSMPSQKSRRKEETADLDDPVSSGVKELEQEAVELSKSSAK